MPENIEQFLKEMNFKKLVFGGVDEEDVLIQIQELCKLYNEEHQALSLELEIKSSEFENTQLELEVESTTNDELRADRAVLIEQIEYLQQRLEEKENTPQQAEKTTTRDNQTAAEKDQNIHAILDDMLSIREDMIEEARVEAAYEAEKIRNRIIMRTKAEYERVAREILELRNAVNTLREEKLAAEAERDVEDFNLIIEQLSRDVDQLHDRSEKLAEGSSWNAS